MRLGNFYTSAACFLLGFVLGGIAIFFHEPELPQEKENFIHDEAKGVLTDMALLNYQLELLDTAKYVELRESMTRRLSAHVAFFEILDSEFIVDVDGISYDEEIAKAKDILETPSRD